MSSTISKAIIRQRRRAGRLGGLAKAGKSHRHNRTGIDWRGAKKDPAKNRACQREYQQLGLRNQEEQKARALYRRALSEIRQRARTRADAGSVMERVGPWKPDSGEPYARWFLRFREAQRSPEQRRRGEAQRPTA